MAGVTEAAGRAVAAEARRTCPSAQDGETFVAEEISRAGTGEAMGDGAVVAFAVAGTKGRAFSCMRELRMETDSD